MVGNSTLEDKQHVNLGAICQIRYSSAYYCDLPLVVPWDYDRGTFTGYTGLLHQAEFSPRKCIAVFSTRLNLAPPCGGLPFMYCLLAASFSITRLCDSGAAGCSARDPRNYRIELF